jgi:alkylation response protein AidB-like acyl-CoA dehydrogenase
VISTDDFRNKVLTWLEQHAQSHHSTDPRDMRASRQFRSALWDAGLLGITLPAKYGGQGLTDEHQKVWAEESRSYSLPGVGEAVTTGICAPTLLDFGNEEQIRAHVPRMIRGEETWTQLLSEPNAGSDLAGLQTRAVRDGDEFVLNGQKVWTSGASVSQYALCVARTNPDAPKHKGISMFIVALDSPGVTIRPLVQMTGEAHFNEVFLDDVHIPAANLVGAENNGWAALLAMLTHERLALGAGTGAGGAGNAWSRSASAEFITLAKKQGLNDDRAVRQELAKLYIAEKVLAYMGQKMRDEIAAGINVGSKGSVAKLATALLSKQSASLGMMLAGPGSQAWSPDDANGGLYAAAVNFAPMQAIAGGTSEIQRNTIGERVLDLPREPQSDKDIPFKDIVQNASRRS